MADIASYTIPVSEMPWEDVAPGIRVKRLWAAVDGEREVVLEHFAPGAQVRIDRRAGDEMVYVLEGAITDECSAVAAGNIGYWPKDSTYTLMSPNGVIMLAYTSRGHSSSVGEGADPASVLLLPSEMAWEDYAPGIRAKLIWSDARRTFTFGHLDPGQESELHRHIGDEMVFLIEGAIQDEYGSARAGDLTYRPQGCTHRVTSRQGATMLAVQTDGGSELIPG